MLPRSIDGLFLPLPPTGKVELVALVQQGTPEEAWAERAFPASQRVAYRLRADIGPCPTTEELLTRSDIHEALKAHGVHALFHAAVCTPGTHAWAARHRVRLWMVDFEEQRRLEDKIWFDAFLRRHRIPAPAGAAITLRGRMETALPFRGRAVIQARDSVGGEGTYFVDGPSSAAALVDAGALRLGERYLVRRYVDGDAYGITVFVAPGRVALSAIRRQCYYPPSGGAPSSRVFAGIQWVPSRALSPRLRGGIDRVFLRLGDLLYERRTFGLANFDFMVDAAERVLVIECNPRMSAATPQLLHFPELLSGGGVGDAFVEGFVHRRAFTRSPARTRVPDTTYEGATLDVVAPPGGPSVVTHAFENGLYRRRADRPFEYVTPDVRQLHGRSDLCVISLARRGQVCQPADTLAEVLSNAPLYGARGEMTAFGRRVSSLFGRVTRA
jgi:hypothetical protein